MIALEARLPALFLAVRIARSTPVNLPSLPSYAHTNSSIAPRSDWSKCAPPPGRSWPWTQAKITDTRPCGAVALAGCGLGKDDPSPDDAARERLRHRALCWLSAGLMAVVQLHQKGTPRERGEIPKRLGRWQVDPSWVGL